MFEVASSRIRIRGSASSARAIEISWRSPAERPAPPSRTTWSSPWSSRAATRSTPTAAAVALHLLVRGVRLGEADVVGDRAAEEERVLEHDAELAPVADELDVAEVGSVDAHGALVGVVEAGDQLRGRRLAAAGLADERDAAAGRDRDLDPVQHRLLAVGERDVVELEPAVDPAERPGAGLVGDVDLRVEDRADLVHRRARRLHLAVQLRELLQRLEDEREQADGRDQRPDLHRAGVDELRAREEHRAGGDRAEQLDRGEEDRVDLLHVHVREPVLLVQPVELGLERALAVERLDHGHPGDRLGQLRGHDRDPRPHVRRGDVGDALEPARDHDRRREDAEGDEPEPPVEQEEPADRGDERERVDDERRQALVEHVGERVDVAVQPRDDPAGLLLREVAQRQRREVVEEVAPQLEHDPLADAREPEPRPRPEHPRRGVDADVGEHGEHEPLVVAGADAVVDRVLDEEPAGDGRGRREGGENRDQRHLPLALGGVGEQAREPGVVLTRQRTRLRRAR